MCLRVSCRLKKSRAAKSESGLGIRQRRGSPVIKMLRAEVQSLALAGSQPRSLQCAWNYNVLARRGERSRAQSGGARRKFAGGRKCNELRGLLWPATEHHLSLHLVEKGRSHFSVINWPAVSGWLSGRICARFDWSRDNLWRCMISVRLFAGDAVQGFHCSSRVLAGAQIISWQHEV